jgi:hypothetical protein
LAGLAVSSRDDYFVLLGSEGSDVPEMNIYQSRSSDDVNVTTSDRLAQAEAQIRACFLTIVEISMT